ncbi:MAG: carboxypeptidase-like regulatory domain-containing protein [Verrucomicrobia bacterium]|nr:carboxypeptidase-like regulatory domain-containing protein [Verrucomicrobiota bacterium]
MNPFSFPSRMARLYLVVAIPFFLGVSHPAGAQTAAFGTIEGRVLNTRNGEYLENARVTVDSTTLETFTDSIGQYRLGNVPVGIANVKVFFTGLDVQSAAINVAPGATVQRDFSLEAMQRPGAGKDSGVVQLSEFVVAASKEMDGAAIAINEQRFASSIRNVVAADEFGAVTDGNVGEFLKFLPGMAINSVGGEARTFMLNGVPPNNVPITIGGFNLAGAAGSSTSRRVELDQVSLNNISRIEVLHSPTPESPGSALAGSINMVPRSAFERSRPVFNGSVYVLMRDNARHFHKTPGPIKDKTRKIYPAFDFSYIVPVNDRFGFTISGGNSTQYTPLDFMQNTWRGGGAATSAPTATGPGNFPDTTFDRPYLSEYQVRDGAKLSRRSSAGATLDYKLTRNDRLSFSFQYAFSDKPFRYRYLIFQTNRVLPGDFTPTSTRGAPGAGELRLQNEARQKAGTTYMPTLVWRHDGPIWKAEGGTGYSHATNVYSDNDKGYFSASQARRTGVTVSFNDIFYLRPRTITVTDAAGRPVDPYDINSYALTTSNGNMRNTTDVQRSAYANLRRDFDLRGVPITLKGGLDVRNSMRDLRGSTPTFTFRGADGRATTTPFDPLGSDDGAGVALDEVASQRTPGFGFPKIQWVSNEKYWDLYKAQPSHFNLDRNAEYRSGVSNSKRADETISSAYIRGDVAFFDRRLRLVGGLRAEQTNLTAEGPLTDATRNFQRDASGKVIVGANGRPLPILPSTDALGVSQLTFIDRGTHAKKEYLRLFPSLNASFNVRENLIARAAFYTSVGRPDFNQYAGGLTLPDTENPPSTGNRISVNNVAIKAWSAKTVKVRLEYYFERVGQVSVGAFRRDFENFFGSTTFEATPEFLALYGLDPAIYDPYSVATQHNIESTVRMTGLEFDYKQALTFLPRWARGVQVFANASALRAIGPATSNFNGFVPRVYNWGVSLTRERYNVRMNWNYRGRSRDGAVTGRSIEPGTYEYTSKILNIEVQGEYYLRKKFAVFATIRNLGAASDDSNIYGPSTPLHARFRDRNDIGAMWTLGLKGTF